MVIFFGCRFRSTDRYDGLSRASGVEVVEKVRPSVTREGTLLQIMDRAGIDRLGVQDPSEAVKRFSGVTVQDYGGSED